jgi:hypothetical protein
VKKFTGIALDTYQYPEYSSPNWIKGESYDAQDDGQKLTLTSETGNFHFIGRAREGINDLFAFQDGDTV